jgi:hypothetical protein
MINIASGGNASEEWRSFGTLGEEFDTIYSILEGNCGCLLDWRL